MRSTLSVLLKKRSRLNLRHWIYIIDFRPGHFGITLLKQLHAYDIKVTPKKGK